MVTDPAVVRPGTLSLLRRLAADERLEAHFLVGGTALALEYGHRLSVDLDLFTREPFDSDRLSAYASQRYGFRVSDKFRNGLMGFIDGVKVDFIRHDYPLVEPLLTEEGIARAHPLDIAAMKLNAISGNGTRVKDYYDMYVLLEHFSLDDMLRAYEVKYPNSGAQIAAKSVAYFDDIDFDYEPALMVDPIDFGLVRARLTDAVRDVYRTFP